MIAGSIVVCAGGWRSWNEVINTVLRSGRWSVLKLPMSSLPEHLLQVDLVEEVCRLVNSKTIRHAAPDRNHKMYRDVDRQAEYFLSRQGMAFRISSSCIDFMMSLSVFHGS